ncbi:sodium/glutamate symporter [Virgibacillus halodenitrificans]|uniref:Sodium/glutamate symporter n=1 Tax=Virgibacillus halodenitrificans TaxID=1482 RepID=A0AAC9J0V6_VIRHA|nr:sodium/glutamate symporter [Virgibacillus halodenitrificans]APC49306.1 sodium/glutamate symporter [Virgibacillus halodenitrificans]MBD1223827.1 sodium/glutamate symporter [Virgibacillus halodenitrificans]MCG1029939.1 sodium/glutamate symporter [Virgibacillus halodenitrificans]MCJ0930064.1 sodium/glutamate symporter [Virgibacillus halodenitrificans]WHX26569.1 sodium/glutamate symporter [Virgibacillus halodenitrificans]
MILELNQVTTIFLAVAVFMIGKYLNSKIGLLDRFCIPAPVVGGLLFAILATLLKTLNLVDVTLDTSLQGLFMLTFFTTVGLGASFGLIKLGGKLLVIYWLACGFLALVQSIIGISFAKLLHIEPLIGVVVGAVSMEGGHGAATAFGTTIEEMGVDSALSVGLAAATVGLVAGGLIGGPIVKYLINKYDLKPSETEHEMENPVLGNSENKKLESRTFMTQIFIITLCMAVGSYVGDLFTQLSGFALPNYVSAMFIAVIVRNILDRINGEIIQMKSISIIGDITLGIFLSMALMSIKLWEVANLALPLLVIVLVQVIFIALFGVFVLFRLLGKNYDAAVMVGGFTGHGLGATPNAIANMDAIVSKFGPSRKAFLVVPIVGAFLIDVFAMPIIITTINMFS